MCGIIIAFGVNGNVGDVGRVMSPVVESRLPVVVVTRKKIANGKWPKCVTEI